MSGEQGSLSTFMFLVLMVNSNGLLCAFERESGSAVLLCTSNSYKRKTIP